jgi:hypothetical protein
MARKHMWVQVYESLVDDQWPHNTHFYRKYHERPFSIIPKANTYGFLTKWRFVKTSGGINDRTARNSLSWTCAAVNPCFTKARKFYVTEYGNNYAFEYARFSTPFHA